MALTFPPFHKKRKHEAECTAVKEPPVRFYCPLAEYGKNKRSVFIYRGEETRLFLQPVSLRFWSLIPR